MEVQGGMDVVLDADVAAVLYLKLRQMWALQELLSAWRLVKTWTPNHRNYEVCCVCTHAEFRISWLGFPRHSRDRQDLRAVCMLSVLV